MSVFVDLLSVLTYVNAPNIRRVPPAPNGCGKRGCAIQPFVTFLSHLDSQNEPVTNALGMSAINEATEANDIVNDCR